ncbi:hypothetical protein ABZ606_03760 [Streptomyces sp. NPDC012461]|uniref:Uncharacterized protein n=2 Tax=unclassified Streptomyces TaxID=2593676 RepID=A0A6G3QR40_9ACTN|nr:MULTISPECIES: hypothetical protein [unclassified Streptomyces]NEA85825.1 hypothetical protein [Streptomyces sp. SID14436]NEC82534.1 hypothetical protein [Streptomyces sp. SID7958]NED18431.1 hypothetical protein [Streptomyces sp. SID9913]HEX5567683.1 hypothetical protein [Streptomyces sp.]
MNDSHDRSTARAGALRAPWTALCAAAAVILGPPAHTASTLTQANAAPRHPSLTPAPAHRRPVRRHPVH